ncbi:MAG: M28 family peptidase [Gemmatimonadales bacterium]|nr:M28 family peptidase [Gemmatimonadales bacterium]NIN13252.1 M28 family peptidase [Gemmatimonadales bacterium]NIN51269.1 M28 family peptidase [Gemmatimonadales bacterium]NIP08733.1 M28 family peptidase [Gemmatimonadales bacterium]NIR00986.1 M28 family peptidase [Gemmatimonadales bacterium]
MIAAGVALFTAAGCRPEDPQLSAALESFSADQLAGAIQVLASDSFEGRAPSSPGEEKTIAYLEGQFEELGLAPGNGDSYLQEVPLVSITADPRARLTIRGAGGSMRFAYGSEFMAWTKRVVDRVSVRDAELVFVGYGIVAPEYGWNDYEGIDVRGKVVVLLVNDPGFATQDTALFTGNTMTYYGRWTYKYEEAARQGAAAALIVHETDPAGYPWAVVEGSWKGEQFDLVREDNNMSRVAVEGWLSLETARTVFTQAGLDYDVLKERAASREFQAVPMSATASITLRNAVRRSTSRNVLAVLPGGDRADEYLVYMAHWDHFGRDPAMEGDQIYNGARDNATGVAGLIELARAFASLETPTRRSLLFLAVTAEEQGLLGSAYYATNPVYPLPKTVAAINLDALNVWGRMGDVTVIGLGNSELDDYLADAARAQGRWVRPDPEPEKGFYFRSDHFNFAKQGVPALYVDEGIDHVEHGEAWTLARREEYTAERYHKPADEYDPSWDLTGLVDDLRLVFRVGYRLASESTFPNWSERSPFKATRDSMMAPAR